MVKVDGAAQNRGDESVGDQALDGDAVREIISATVEDQVRGLLPLLLDKLLADRLATALPDLMLTLMPAALKATRSIDRVDREAAKLSRSEAEESERREEARRIDRAADERRDAEARQAEARRVAEREAEEEAATAFSAAVAGELATAGELGAGAALFLRFADANGFIAALPAVEVGLEQFEIAGGRALYAERIDFRADLDPVTVTAVWLVGSVEGELKAVRCEIAGGLRIGAGAQARIPAGHLIF